MPAKHIDADVLVQYITETFDGVNPLEAAGDYYFLYDPERNLPPNRQHPFATLITGDRHDQFSDLDRPGVYRLNLGVSRETFQSLVGADATSDFTELDRLMPHPVYGQMHWLCVLNPSEATFESLKPLLAEAHLRAVRRIHRE
jgi:hypothetical protein